MLERLWELFQRTGGGGLQADPGMSKHDFQKDPWSRMNVGSAMRVLGEKAVQLIKWAFEQYSKGNNE